MKKFVFIILVLVYFTSCSDDKIINFDLSDYDSKIVVNSVNNSDSLVKVFLSKTVALVTDTVTFDNIKNAHIELYNDLITSSLDSFVLSDTLFNYGYYYNPSLTASIYDDSVYLKVSSIQGDAFSKSEIPKKPELKDFSCEYLFDSISQYGRSSYFVDGHVNFTLTDDEPDKMNYYAVKVFYYKNNNHLRNVELTNSVPVLYDTYIYNEGYIFSDSLFSNNEFTATFDFSIWFGDYSNVVDTFYVEVKKITQDYYLYQKTYKQHLEAEQSIFTEYIDVYTNIENGYGIFTVYSSKCLKFNVQ